MFLRKRLNRVLKKKTKDDRSSIDLSELNESYQKMRCQIPMILNTIHYKRDEVAFKEFRLVMNVRYKSL